MYRDERSIRSKVFTPKQPLPNPNQQSFRLNYLTEFLSQQINQNEAINESIDKVLSTVHQTQHTQEVKIEQILKVNKEQTEISTQFLEKFENQGKTTADISNSLQELQDQNKQLSENIGKEQLINQAILDQLSFQDQQLKNTNSLLTNYVDLAMELTTQLQLQEKMVQEMDQKLQLHDVYHNTVMERLDKQEAFNEKIIRQLDFLKSLVFERVNLVIEKVENSYQSTTDYLNGLVSKTGFMKPFLLSSRPKEKSEKNNND
ncbi:hypothetical protein ACFSO7_16760 [Bacillus sp. CGMCC 1.16607]|uniref:hypothetical protein n=1 Tax=Bacillus sp. CGMCC 1.16607 TaxID=3351842 RepID=UPI00363C16EE